MLTVQYDKISKKKNIKKNEIVQKILKEYKLKMNSFHPKGDSPNIFVNKLEYRMNQYFNLYKSKNDSIK